MFKKLFIPLVSVIATTSSLAFVSCDLGKGKKLQNIFTNVDYQKDLETKKSTVKSVIDSFLSDVEVKVDQKNNEAKKHLDFIKNNITHFIDPLTKFLIIIDKQSKEFLDFFYKKNERFAFGINLNNQVSINKKQIYSNETILGSNNLVKEFNKVIKAREALMEESTKKTSFFGVDLLVGMWLDNFEKNSKDGIFEKIGNKILKNKIAIDFWNKFINNRFHETL